MKPSPSTDSAGMVRDLLRASRQGALATLMTGSGAPYCSLVNVAPDADGAPLLLVSALALHTQNIVSDARVSLMLDERRAGDPLEGARIMLAGEARAVVPDDLPRIRRRYLAFHPSAADFAGFADFSFLKVIPAGVHLVAGFGRIVDLPPSRFLTPVEDAQGLLAAEEEIVAHLNADHRDTMNLYAVHLADAPSADWHCVACDPDGLDLAAEGRTLRLAFPKRVTTPEVLRMTLKELAAQARAKAG
jgi:putative heme iron utilization protein